MKSYACLLSLLIGLVLLCASSSAQSLTGPLEGFGEVDFPVEGDKNLLCLRLKDLGRNAPGEFTVYLGAGDLGVPNRSQLRFDWTQNSTIPIILDFDREAPSARVTVGSGTEQRVLEYKSSQLSAAFANNSLNPNGFAVEDINYLFWGLQNNEGTGPIQLTNVMINGIAYNNLSWQGAAGGNRYVSTDISDITQIKFDLVLSGTNYGRNERSKVEICLGVDPSFRFGGGAEKEVPAFPGYLLILFGVVLTGICARLLLKHAVS